jgi:hypothetical protein
MCIKIEASRGKKNILNYLFIMLFKNYTHGNLFYLQDKELDFDTLLTAPLPKIPQTINFTCKPDIFIIIVYKSIFSTLSAHWLSIEGIQPLIPENPPQTCNIQFLNMICCTTMGFSSYFIFCTKNRASHTFLDR